MHIAMSEYCSYGRIEEKGQGQDNSPSNAEGDANIMERKAKTT